MNLKGQMVIHGTFGEGTIISHSDGYMTVAFEQGDKVFVYPDALKGFLQIKNKSLIESIKQEVAKVEAEKKQAEKEKKERAEAERLRKIREADNIKNSRVKVYPRFNVAFKCNYCDGGKSPTQIGYSGVCSDDLISYNIEIENRTWCSGEGSACRQYLARGITRKELDAMCERGKFVCYESQMLRKWRAYAGIVQSGKNKGRPMKMNNVQLNSLCVLTTRDPRDKGEEERYIFAAFLVDESYEGDAREEGYVTTSSEFKITLTPNEARTMHFWNYHANDNQPEQAKWNQGLHRYFEDEEAAQILRDIAALKKGTKDEELSERFFRHYCKINGVDTGTLPEPCGALKRR